MILDAGQPPPWYTWRNDAATQRRARRLFVAQAQRRIVELTALKQLNAVVAVATILRAAGAEMVDAPPREHRCGAACEWAAGE
jgi:hypothetical protein